MGKQESAARNYSNIVFAHFFNTESMCYERGHCHFLIYVISGELCLKETGKQDILVPASECAFVRRNHRLTFIKRPSDGLGYKGITMAFDQPFLRNYVQTSGKTTFSNPQTVLDSSVIKLPNRPTIDSLFLSLMPYFNSDIKPIDEVMKLRRQEGVLTLLHVDSRFYPILFDFKEPWKIDILDFLNENYMFEFSLKEIATYTGRSLATFKRDFKKISDLTPQRWLIQKRLDVAKEILQTESGKIADVYMEVGFKNRSHFVTAYKKHFGYSPNENPI